MRFILLTFVRCRCAYNIRFGHCECTEKQLVADHKLMKLFWMSYRQPPARETKSIVAQDISVLILYSLFSSSEVSSLICLGVWVRCARNRCVGLSSAMSQLNCHRKHFGNEWLPYDCEALAERASKSAVKPTCWFRFNRNISNFHFWHAKWILIAIFIASRILCRWWMQSSCSLCSSLRIPSNDANSICQCRLAEQYI